MYKTIKITIYILSQTKNFFKTIIKRIKNQFPKHFIIFINDLKIKRIENVQKIYILTLIIK